MGEWLKLQEILKAEIMTNGYSHGNPYSKYQVNQISPNAW